MIDVVALSEGYYKNKVREIGEQFSISNSGELGVWMTTDVNGSAATKAKADFAYRADLVAVKPGTYIGRKDC